MRRTTFIVISLSILLITFFSCQKKNGNSIACNMKGTVNAREFNGTNAIALSGPDSILTIYGGFFSGTLLTPPYIFINLCPYRGVGVYTFTSAPVGLTVVNYAAIDSFAFYSPGRVSVSGSVTITATAPAVEGSFSFTTLDAINASGSFIAKAP